MKIPKKTKNKEGYECLKEMHAQGTICERKKFALIILITYP